MNKNREETIEWLNNLKSFVSINNEWFLLDIPRMSKEDYNKYVIPNYIRCGAIAKKDLIIDAKYKGCCRNANTAIWKGDHFEYIRYKFGSSYIEDINHFEDDDGYDLFIPMELS